MSNKLKFWRLERQVSQIELAIAAGVPRYRIQFVEQGVSQLSIDEAQRIASILGCKPTDLLPNLGGEWEAS